MGRPRIDSTRIVSRTTTPPVSDSPTGITPSTRSQHAVSNYAAEHRIPRHQQPYANVVSRALPTVHRIVIAELASNKRWPPIHGWKSFFWRCAADVVTWWQHTHVPTPVLLWSANALSTNATPADATSALHAASAIPATAVYDAELLPGTSAVPEHTIASCEHAYGRRFTCVSATGCASASEFADDVPAATAHWDAATGILWSTTTDAVSAAANAAEQQPVHRLDANWPWRSDVPGWHVGFNVKLLLFPLFFPPAGFY